MVQVRQWVVTGVVLAVTGCGNGGSSGSGDPSEGGGTSGTGAGGSGDSGGSGGSGAGTGGVAITTPQSCAERSAEIAAAAGNTIEVEPGSFGRVLVDGSETTLRQVVSDASSGDTILLADGTYTFEEAPSGSYTGLYFTTGGISLRGASGDASTVILDSGYADHGGSTAAITVDAPNTVLADFTVKSSIFHLIHLQSNADGSVVHNVHLIDGGQQFLKASGTEIDDVEVSCSQFVMTSEGRDNVWGYGDVDGGTTCYTGGIDTHDSRDWWVHDSYFDGIYCNPDGVERPAHDKKADERGNQTYTGGLAEHAIHMWDAADGHGHVIERNRIVNCARGIGLGMADEVYDTIIRNNMVFSEHPGSAEHDVGINVERAHDTLVANNTVFFAAADAYPNAIEYRWSSTANLEVRNNLTNRLVRMRDGADAGTTASNNVEDADASWFEDVATGDLHLSSCDLAEVVGQGMALPSVSDDIDQDPRADANDIGADQCE